MGVKLGLSNLGRVFANRVLRIFVPKREEGAGDWRRLHNEELHNFYASPNIRVIKSRRMRLVGHVAHTRDINVCQVLIGKREGKRCFDRPGYMWEDNIRRGLRLIGWKVMD
jgi:hypothetical protein